MLDRMTALGLRGVYVTFVDELASRNEACVSMVATVIPDNPAGRTYELVIAPGCLLLCNESFASTNEREGSEIARQVIRALTEAGIRIIFVTHLYDLAERCHAQNTGGGAFLRAERRSDRRRTFRLLEGEPLPTSYGQDLYQQVFGTAYETAHA